LSESSSERSLKSGRILRSINTKLKMRNSAKASGLRRRDCGGSFIVIVSASAQSECNSQAAFKLYAIKNLPQINRRSCLRFGSAMTCRAK
jgi:hypothetical protein